MTDPAPALDKLPNWPRWLNQRQAAAYVGVSVGTFAKELAKGTWPAPGRASGRWRLWDRLLLDATSDRISNLSTGTQDLENGYGRDPDYIKRRLEAAYGDEEHSPPRLSAHRG